MKIIFLDIDGVLNTSKTYMDYELGLIDIEIDLEKIKLLKIIIEETNALIVLSSAWKNFGKMINHKFVPDRTYMQLFIDYLKNLDLEIYVGKDIVLLLLFILSIIFMMVSSYNPFIYFRF